MLNLLALRTIPIPIVYLSNASAVRSELADMKDSVGVAYEDDLGESFVAELVVRKRVRVGTSLSSGFES